MNYYNHWEECVRKIEQGQIKEAESYAVKTASKFKVKQELIDKIFSVNLQSYEKKIEEFLIECIQRGKQENAKALLLYYSLDNGWDSTIYICQDYDSYDNKWCSSSTSWVDIGKARGFSGIYKKDAEAAFFCDEISSGICILLMLRTTIAFYNVAVKYKECGMKLCVTCTESDFVVIE